MSNLIDRARAWKQANNFSLYAHRTGRWARKILGITHFFGPIDEDIAGSAKFALDTYLAQRDDLAAGRKPRPKGEAGGLTIRELCNAFLASKDAALATGEISRRTRADYGKMKAAPDAEPSGPEGTCDRIIKQFGKERAVSDLRPEDFAEFRAALGKGRGLQTLSNEIQRARCVFRFAADAELIDAPVRFGKSFEKPTRKTLRIERAAKGEQMYSAADLRKILAAATPELKAQVLLALNAGFGNGDCAALPIKAIDLDAGWIDFPRPKTGVPRRVPLWRETVDALRDVLSRRRKPKNEAHADRVFVTLKSGTFGRDMGGGATSKEFGRLCKALGIDCTGFYSLRRTFRTVADGSRDQPACDSLMGHLANDMASIYRQRIEDDRLRAVVDHVHAWLWPVEKTTTPRKPVTKGKAIAKPRKPKETKAAPRLTVFAG
jgi:integrase